MQELCTWALVLLPQKIHHEAPYSRNPLLHRESQLKLLSPPYSQFHFNPSPLPNLYLGCMRISLRSIPLPTSKPRTFSL